MAAMTTGTSVRRGFGVLLLPSILVGCAAYQLPLLPTSHPAHPEASASPARPPSQTLAYTAADVPSVQPVASAPVALPEPRQPGGGEVTAATTVVGEGEVVATVPGSSQIVVDHGEIKNFMEPMTMGYRVDPPSLLAGLSEGDKIRFTIDVRRRAIVQIEKLP